MGKTQRAIRDLAYGATKIASVSRSAEQLKYASLWFSVVAPGHIVCQLHCLFDSSLSSSVVVPIKMNEMSLSRFICIETLQFAYQMKNCQISHKNTFKY